MHYRVPWQVDVVRKTAPQVRRLLSRRVAVTDGLGIVAPVSVLAVTILAEVTPLALAAGDIMLDEHQVALAKPFALGELAPGLGDGADVLVAHDDRRGGRRLLVQLDVGAADAGDVHPHQGGVGRDIRHGKLAQLGFARAHPHRRQHLLCHVKHLHSSRAGPRIKSEGRLDPRVHRLCLGWMDCRVEPGNDEKLSPCCARSMRIPNTWPPSTGCGTGRASASGSAPTPRSWCRRCPAACPAVRRWRPWWRSGATTARARRGATSSSCSSRWPR